MCEGLMQTYLGKQLPNKQGFLDLSSGNMNSIPPPSSFLSLSLTH